MRSTMASITSNASASGEAVIGSGVMTSLTGRAGSRPTARTRERRSRSVMMPVNRSPSMISSADTPCSAMVAAASRIVVDAVAHTGSRRTRSPARMRSTASPVVELDSASTACRIRAARWSEKNRATAGWSRTSR